VDLGFEHEALGVYQQVTLPPFDLLASVVTSIIPRRLLVAPFWIELPRAEHMLQVPPAMVN
jgi:hypothetical protein